MQEEDFELRVDVYFSAKNLSPKILDWFKKKYKLHPGTKAEFIRELIILLYKYEMGMIEEQSKQELKDEVLGYVIKKIQGEEIKIESNTKKKKEEGILKEVTKEQAKAQDFLLGQLDNL